ncbi:MAG: undecaprenyldiphospho-muramoylpentapeptide beta-N-acetylglucosaminyltransferase, partial [Bacilli bacterium]|nr:undecaprenyldiphospho-muramoylpentapeptide beta-N-acetylglucosaminyltransferase [Bacilli bacterium]
FDSYKNIKVSSNVKVVPFLNDLISLMKVADLIVSRAGASSLVEITAAKLPSILIPSPYVTNNHQYMNAKVLEDNNACVIIEEKDFDSSKLVDTIDEIFSDNKRYLEMKKASGELAVNDSATKIYNELKKLVDGD